MATPTNSYRITLTELELSALSDFLTTENPVYVSSVKALNSAATKIQVQAFKAQVGAITPAYKSTGTVIRTKNLDVNDLGGASDLINSPTVKPDNLEINWDEATQLEAQMLKEVTNTTGDL